MRYRGARRTITRLVKTLTTSARTYTATSLTLFPVSLPSSLSYFSLVFCFLSLFFLGSTASPLRPPRSGRGSKRSLVPAKNKKVKFSCAFTALSLPYKNNATRRFQRGAVSSRRAFYPSVFRHCIFFLAVFSSNASTILDSNRIVAFRLTVRRFKAPSNDSRRFPTRRNVRNLQRNSSSETIFPTVHRVATLQSDHEAPDRLVAPFKTIETFLSSIEYVFPAKEADARSSATSLIAHFPLNTRFVSYCLHALRFFVFLGQTIAAIFLGSPAKSSKLFPALRFQRRFLSARRRNRAGRATSIVFPSHRPLFPLPDVAYSLHVPRPLSSLKRRARDERSNVQSNFSDRRSSSVLSFRRTVSRYR